MDNIINFKTSNFPYFYNRKREEIFIGNSLYQIFEKWDENQSKYEEIVDDSKINVELGYSKEEIKYYYKKYRFYRKYNIISKTNNKKINALWKVEDAEFYELIFSKCNYIILEMTENCNLSCKYCGNGELYEYSHEYGGNELKIETVKKFFDYWEIYWLKYSYKYMNREITVSFYGGEPLLKFNRIKDVVNMLSVRYPTMKFIYKMTTNGTLISKNIEFLVENDFYITISLDGDQKANQYRVDKKGRPIYGKVFDNLKEIQLRYPLYFKKRIQFLSVFTDKNSVKRILNYFKRNFNKLPRISNLEQYGVNEDHRELYRNMYNNYFLELNNEFKNKPKSKILIEYFTKASKNIKQNFSKSVFRNNVYELNEILYRKSIPQAIVRGCIPLSNKLFLSASGDVNTCEKVSKQYKWGSVYNDPIIDFSYVGQEYTHYINYLRKQCNTCYDNAINCNFCIFLMNFEKEGSEIICKGYKNKEDFAKYLSANVETLEKYIAL